MSISRHLHNWDDSCNEAAVKSNLEIIELFVDTEDLTLETCIIADCAVELAADVSALMLDRPLLMLVFENDKSPFIIDNCVFIYAFV